MRAVGFQMLLEDRDVEHNRPRGGAVEAQAVAVPVGGGWMGHAGLVERVRLVLVRAW